MTNQTTGQHTPGAVRAAKRWTKYWTGGRENAGYEVDLAKIIDEETHAGELVTALKALFEHCAMVHKCWGDSDNTKEADAAIESARTAIDAATKE